MHSGTSLHSALIEIRRDVASHSPDVAMMYDRALREFQRNGIATIKDLRQQFSQCVGKVRFVALVILTRARMRVDEDALFVALQSRDGLIRGAAAYHAATLGSRCVRERVLFQCRRARSGALKHSYISCLSHFIIGRGDNAVIEELLRASSDTRLSSLARAAAIEGLGMHASANRCDRSRRLLVVEHLKEVGLSGDPLLVKLARWSLREVRRAMRAERTGPFEGKKGTGPGFRIGSDL